MNGLIGFWSMMALALVGAHVGQIAVTATAVIAVNILSVAEVADIAAEYMIDHG